ncbi:ATP-binding cassette subfamily B protein [Paenibacillus phyllosphaerae]|uniref:ATP-binding cassette subfamily B protein n=1 Tax=Paenibacillus phyllosphaerae TaxID=274593 RepID=A0A7W5FL19_9BACL|nr:ABC transporter ATP-binding protein [Paenibacillus phyllosphaerae]MBB3108613.1 ATP-binding cassette subfamily B protein [Paenibacillus phyllosphaerae]
MKLQKSKVSISHYAALMRRYLLPQRGALIGLTALLFASIALQLVNPQIIRYFIDTAQGQGSMTPLYYAAGLFIAFSLVQQIVSVIATFMSENVAWRTTNKLRGDLAEHCLTLDMNFHKSHTSGAIIERVDGDVNALANFFSSMIIHLAGNVLLIAGIIALLYRENWMIGLGMTLFAVFAIFIIQWIRKFAVPIWSSWRQVNAEFYGFVGEQLEGTEDIRANGASGYVMRRFYGLVGRMLPVRVKAFLGFATMWNATIVIFALGNALAFGVSAYLWHQGEVSLGTVYLIFYYTELLAKPIEKIRTQLEDLQKADASIVRINELFEMKSLIADGPGTPIGSGPLSVELSDVSFSYEGAEGKPTLRQLDFRLAPGEVLGLLGRTGSGKSTLARLLLRFYDPQQGAIRLGGTDIRDAKVSELRSRVAMVTQSIEIMEGTVRDNLTFYDEQISDARIAEVLDDLGLGSWYASLPQGLDTMLASGGGGLSAGEAQLLAFARVFLSDPGLIIMDEASSRLDPLTEQRIERATQKLLEARTCIIIAHRLATVQRADRILVLEDGEIVEEGLRAALAAEPGSRFSRMMKTGMEEVLV